MLGGAEPRPVWVVDLGGAQVPPPTPGASPSRVDHKSFHFLEVVDNERRCKQLPTHAAKKVHVLTSFALLCEQGSSVTLIFYALDKRWWSTGSEPFLNLVAAAAQFSKFTHVELAIGEDSGARGEMINVLRIFNDDTGVVTWAPPIPPDHPTPPPPSIPLASNRSLHRGLGKIRIIRICSSGAPNARLKQC